MAPWQYALPDLPEVKTPPPRPASSFPLGTVATDETGYRWVVEWDAQDRQHMWVEQD